RLALPAVGQHAIALVQEALLVQLFERPHHRLHEPEVHGLVAVRHVDPARLAADVAGPRVARRADDAAAVIVEAINPEFLDGDAAGDAQLLLGLHLDGQAVTIPSEASL